MTTDANEQKRAKISQTDMPNISLEEALRIPNAIWDNYAGKGTAPHSVAMALDLSPTSGGWRNMCGASIAYGLTEGGYNATTIELTDLGRSIVAPTAEGIDRNAIRDAVLKPKMQSEFFRQYDRAKFPKQNIAENVIIEKGIPKDRAAGVVNLLVENGKFAGIIVETKTGPFVSLNIEQARFDNTRNALEVDAAEEEREVLQQQPVIAAPRKELESSDNNRVFITHGKNQTVLEQIKKVVALGGFTPIVSVQSESVAMPIPEKIISEMRKCGASVIHVGSEGTLKDSLGNDEIKINPNVLIEIGASMALYEKRFILVVEKGVVLPSNLQGLYECRYSGDDIGLEAGLKILEALRGLRMGS